MRKKRGLIRLIVWNIKKGGRFIRFSLRKMNRVERELGYEICRVRKGTITDARFTA